MKTLLIYFLLAFSIGTNIAYAGPDWNHDRGDAWRGPRHGGPGHGGPGRGGPPPPPPPHPYPAPPPPVELRATTSAVGVDDRDCMAQVQYRTDLRVRDMVYQCQAMTNNRSQCYVAYNRLIQYPSPIGQLIGQGNYDERTDETSCRVASVQRAEEIALRDCSAAFGVQCMITARGVVTHFSTYQRRRYGLFGPRDTYYVCQAEARASAAPPYRFQCTSETVVRSY